MMGSKKLSEIKQELRQLLARDEKNLSAWLDSSIAELETDSTNRPNALKELLWLRALLREGVQEEKLPSKKATKPLTQTTLGLDRQSTEPQRDEASGARLAEELQLICDLLREAVAEKESGGNKAKKSRARKTPAA